MDAPDVLNGTREDYEARMLEPCGQPRREIDFGSTGGRRATAGWLRVSPR